MSGNRRVEEAAARARHPSAQWQPDLARLAALAAERFGLDPTAVARAEAADSRHHSGRPHGAFAPPGVG